MPTAEPMVVRAFAYGGGGFALLLGASVVAGWHLHIRALVQIHQDLVPMLYNTALCFAALGAATLLRLSGRAVAASVVALVVAVLAAATLAQYVLGVDLGIDQALMRQYIETRTKHLGRMAPNTATAHLLAAIGVLCCCRRGLWSFIGAVACGCLVSVIGQVSTLGYLSGTTDAYGWGGLTRMALQTAVGFACLGIGIIATACASAPDFERRFRRRLPWLAGAMMVIMTAIYWWAMQTHFANTERANLASGAISAKSELVNGIATRVRSLERMANRWAFRAPEESEWRHDAQAHLGHFPDFQAIAWVDQAGIERWVYPIAGNEQAIDADLGRDPIRGVALRAARASGETVFTPIVELLQGGMGVLAIVPIRHEDGHLGWIVGVFRVEHLLEAVIESGLLLSRYHVRIAQDEVVAYADGEPPSDAHVVPQIVELYGSRWTMDVWRRPETSAAEVSRLQHVLLLFGFACASLLVAALRQARRADDAARDAAAVNAALATEIEQRRATERQLSAAKEAAEAAARIKSDFLATMSHEIRTPMNGIIGMLSLMLDSKLSPDQKRWASTALDSAETLLTIINDILDLSKLDAGKTEMELLDFDVVGLIDGVTALLKVRATAKGIALRTDIEPNVPKWLKSDPTRLRQILFNLVGNAVKFTQRGEVMVRASVGAIRADSCELRIDVTDTGIGIDRDK
ncbi:MAG TPA: histidine kinase dimerization/phospho-acceptor domain-containing protein, partial [Planctomycetota bacterium]|nr:histidine kinase dimerization/phospho-acceptor domain-containing protein [Planctomycetota bacterium]